MKYVSFVITVFISFSASAACITPDSSVAEKSKVGSAINSITGGVKSWTEVKAGTNLLETKNTIKLLADYRDPFKSRFNVGRRSTTISKICLNGRAVQITTAEGNATLVKTGEHISIQTFIGTFQVLPTNKVKQDKAESFIPQKYEDQNNYETTVAS